MYSSLQVPHLGIDWDGPMPVDGDNIVVVPHTFQPLSDEDYEEMCLCINPLAHSVDNGIDTYLEALRFVRRKLI